MEMISWTDVVKGEKILNGVKGKEIFCLQDNEGRLNGFVT
jgi:hypothetical protein